jgi:hypothetical protein
MNKLYDGGKIIAGLIIGLAVLFLWPFVYDRSGSAKKVPDVKLADKAKEAGACVAPTSYMTKYHMVLLDDWRHSVVRDGDRYYDTAEGTWHLHLRLVRDYIQDAPKHAGERLYQPVESKIYYKGLQTTCMDCHSNKSTFCDQCHDYVGVSPYCWDCHIAPKENE